MELFVGYNSALEYWRKRRKLPAKSAQRRYPVGLPEESPAVEHLLYSGLTLPIHIVVGKPGARRLTRIVRSHVFTGETPVGCFMNIGRSFTVSSPEFCFLQMASQLTLIELIELGYEFCGVYSLPLPNDKDVPEKGFYDRQQLTSTRKLREFLDIMPGTKGHQKAMRALCYLQDGSASPMETKLTMFLTLPYKQGGYGFTMPELNHRITLPKATRRYFSKNYYVCDLFWPDTKVAVEYDSDRFHTGSERIANDSVKRNALALAGTRVISVTRRQLYKSSELEGAVRTIAMYMGRRLFSKKSDFPTAHRELRRQLLLGFERYQQG